MGNLVKKKKSNNKFDSNNNSSVIIIGPEDKKTKLIVEFLFYNHLMKLIQQNLLFHLDMHSFLMFDFYLLYKLLHLDNSYQQDKLHNYHYHYNIDQLYKSYTGKTV